MTRQLELARHVDGYLAIREAVGLTNTRHERGLRDFIAYARNAGAADGSPIRAATAVAWGMGSRTCDVWYQRARRSAHRRPRLSQLSGRNHSGDRSTGLRPPGILIVTKALGKAALSVM
jgi:hypothetical protein